MLKIRLHGLPEEIEKAKKEGYKLVISVWEGQYERDEGLGIDTPLDEYVEEYVEDCKEEEEEVNLASYLLYGLDSNYGRSGCAEIIAKKDSDAICFYHEERNDTYLWHGLFDFLYGPCEKSSECVVQEPYSPERLAGKILDEVESIVMSHHDDEITTEELYNKIFELRKKYNITKGGN